MPFSTLVGNDLAKKALLKMVEQKSVPNTLLFYGPEGVGKSRFAQAFAQILMGEESTQKLASGNHPDLHLFYPEGKSNIHPIENIRKLTDEVALPPYEAPVKVFIIHEAHQMLKYSSNALLKTLEEPPLHSYFILLTNDLDAMLPTILSRSRKIAFFPIPQPQIETLVKEEWKKSAEEARRIAFLAHGSLAKAAQLSQDKAVAWRAPLLEVLSMALPAEYPQFIKKITEIEKLCTPSDDEEEAASIHGQSDALFEEMLAWYRDLHLLKNQTALEYIYHLEHIEQLKMLASRRIPSLEKVLEEIGQARLALQRNVRLKVALEHLLLRLD
jgi:DNA polymerase-3 subunit delta'